MMLALMYGMMPEAEQRAAGDAAAREHVHEDDEVAALVAVLEDRLNRSMSTPGIGMFSPPGRRPGRGA